MEIAICDDEEAVQKKLKQLIKKNLPQSRIAVYDSGQQLLKSQEKNWFRKWNGLILFFWISVWQN